MRKTKQRQVILEALGRTKKHPTADKVYEMARNEIPDISLGTVYRNLEVLSGAGLIQRLDPGTGQKKYDGNTDPHHHMVCDVCGSVEDVPDDINLEISYDSSAVKEFSVKGYIFYLKGICLECGRRKKES